MRINRPRVRGIIGVRPIPPGIGVRSIITRRQFYFQKYYLTFEHAALLMCMCVLLFLQLATLIWRPIDTLATMRGEHSLSLVH
jgi:hypothetical protein